jgi:hypothetical protein
MSFHRLYATSMKPRRKKPPAASSPKSSAQGARQGGAHEPGAVEERVDPPEALHGGAHHRAARLEVAHVDEEGGDVAAACGELGQGAREARAIAVGQCEPHSLAREASGERTAEAAGRAGGERHVPAGAPLLGPPTTPRPQARGGHRSSPRFRLTSHTGEGY